MTNKFDKTYKMLMESIENDNDVVNEGIINKLKRFTSGEYRYDRDYPDDKLIMYAQEGTDEDKCVLAQREKLPVEAIKELANAKNKSVKMWVAKRADLPNDVMVKLANDDDFEVKMTLAANSKLTSKAADALYGTGENKNIIMALMRNKNFFTFDNIRNEIIMNPNKFDSISHRWLDRPDVPSEMIIGMINNIKNYDKTYYRQYFGQSIPLENLDPKVLEYAKEHYDLSYNWKTFAKDNKWRAPKATQISPKTKKFYEELKTND